MAQTLHASALVPRGFVVDEVTSDGASALMTVRSIETTSICPGCGTRSLKYECVYILAFETGSALRAGLARWMAFYNAVRPHTALDGRTPDEAYYEIAIPALPGLAPAMLDNKLAA